VDKREKMKLSEKLVWGTCVVMGVIQFITTPHVFDMGIIGTLAGVWFVWFVIGKVTLWIWGKCVVRVLKDYPREVV
jgi:hypothetical protein